MVIERRQPDSIKPPDALFVVSTVTLLIAAAMFAGGLGVAGSMTPVRFVAAAVCSAFGIGTTLVATYKVLVGSSWHSWALTYVQVLLVATLVVGILTALGVRLFFLILPDQAVIVIGYAAAIALPFAFAERIRTWTAWTDPGAVLLAVMIVTVVATIGPVAAGALPDPTQVSSDALDLRAELACQQPGSVTVAIDVDWSRTDLWPDGLLGQHHWIKGDRIYVTVDDHMPGSGPPGGGIDGSYDWAVTDTPPGAPSLPALTLHWEGSLAPETWGLSGDGNIVIDHGAIAAGHDYHFAGTSAINMTSQIPRRLYITYRHGERFNKTLEVGCTS